MVILTLITIAHPYIMFMEAVDVLYSSVTDCRWFLGNPNLHETRGFTWSINSSLLSAAAADWHVSFSESAADYTNIAGSLRVLRPSDDNRQASRSALIPL